MGHEIGELLIMVSSPKDAKCGSLVLVQPQTGQGSRVTHIIVTVVTLSEVIRNGTTSEASSRHSRRFPPIRIRLVSSVLPLPSRCLFLFYFVSRARSISVHIHSIHFRSCPRLVSGIALLYSFHLSSSIYKYIMTCRHYCASLVR